MLGDIDFVVPEVVEYLGVPEAPSYFVEEFRELEDYLRVIFFLKVKTFLIAPNSP